MNAIANKPGHAEVERIREYLQYNSDTGVFTWAKTNSARALAGATAGTLKSNGYIRISLDRKFWYAHRLAWLLVHGVMPIEVDHINGDRADNRLVNLRACTRAQNNMNLRSRTGGTSKQKGVCFFRRDGTWQAEIQVNYKRIFLGRFENEQDAAAAYRAAAHLHFGEFVRAE